MLLTFFKVGVQSHKRIQRRIAADDDDQNGGHDSDLPSAPEQVHTPSINATEVIQNKDEKEDDVVKEVVDNAHGKEVEQEVTEQENEPADDNEDDDMSLSSKIEALRSKEGIDDDDVILRIKYQPTNQNLIPVVADVETAVMHDDNMEVEVVGEKPTEFKSMFEDNSFVYFGADGQSFGIEDVDTYMKIQQIKFLKKQLIRLTWNMLSN
ncbi:hypothetical protein Dimus_030749 [Dionaea muscipula]